MRRLGLSPIQDRIIDYYFLVHTNTLSVFITTHRLENVLKVSSECHAYIVHPISVNGRKRSKTLQNENDVRKYHRRVCLQRAHRVQHTSPNVQVFCFRTFQCGQSKTHQNGSVDANRSMQFG